MDGGSSADDDGDVVLPGFDSVCMENSSKFGKPNRSAIAATMSFTDLLPSIKMVFWVPSMSLYLQNHHHHHEHIAITVSSLGLTLEFCVSFYILMCPAYNLQLNDGSNVVSVIVVVLVVMVMV